MKSVIVGTAGHIDHGKTALVKALTGIDADRLEEEKRRGITIDLGFAHLELPGANREMSRFGFVDVPGHEQKSTRLNSSHVAISYAVFCLCPGTSVLSATCWPELAELIWS